MYGLILQNLTEYVRQKHGSDVWEKVKAQLSIEKDDFDLYESFSDSQVAKMGKAAMKQIGIKDEEFYEGMGKYFVITAKDAGMEETLMQLGRRIREFFLNLDNLHDYLKYTFPKMKAPSFFVEDENETTLFMQYRTRRRGFHYYVQGQVKAIAKMLFIKTGQLDNKLDAKLIKQEIVFDTAVFHYELTFDNKGFKEHQKALAERSEVSMPIRANVIFDMFPFCILYEKTMLVKNMGSALRNIIPHMVGRKLTEFFELIKPLIDFSYEVIETRINSMFELATQDEVDKLRSDAGTSSGVQASSRTSGSISLEDLEDTDKTLHIKGQMVFIDEWQCMLFLACPIMKGLNSLVYTGLFINDLSMHDYSRDIMLANAQTELADNLQKMEQMAKDAGLRRVIEKADGLKKKNEQLAFAFVPTQIEVELLQGKSAEELASKVDLATVLEVSIDGLSEICGKAKPLDVCNFFNNVESVFDNLVKKHKCCIVERFSRYIVESGAAEKDPECVEKMANLALDLVDATEQALRSPADKKSKITVKIGIASGPTASGVVNPYMPKFLVFGDSMDKVEKILDDMTGEKGNLIWMDSVTKEKLPPSAKAKEKKDLPGVGQIFHLQDMEGRSKLKSDEIVTLEPVDPATQSEEAAATKPEAGEAASTKAGEEPAGGGDSEDIVHLSQVAVTSNTQCCGQLKSGVCIIL